MKRAALVAALIALAAGGTASGASGSWAAKANAVCRAYTAKAQALLGGTVPKTLAQEHTFIAKAVPLEAEEANVLARIPGRTAAGTHAIAALRTDLAEAHAVLAAWPANKARFKTLFNAYMSDHRPKTAFDAAGATACG